MQGCDDAKTSHVLRVECEYIEADLNRNLSSSKIHNAKCAADRTCDTLATKASDSLGLPESTHFLHGLFIVGYYKWSHRQSLSPQPEQSLPLTSIRSFLAIGAIIQEFCRVSTLPF
jgi:hypothetical protein